jgi:L-asparaginase
MRKSVWMVVCLVVTVFFWLNFAAAAPPVVKLIATGGTIAMKIDPVKKAPVPAISGEDLLATVPDISKYATVEVENLANVPSDYMDADLWVKL